MDNTFGFLGYGRMARALYKGITLSGIYNNNVFVSNKSSININNDTLKVVSSPDLVSCSNIIFICVKPYQLDDLFKDLESLDFSGKTIVSILAGIPISRFESFFGPSISIVRAMPNTAVSIGAGMTGLSFNSFAQFNKTFFIDLFSSFGKAIECSEDQMDSVTALAGSSPAFFYRIVQQFISVSNNKLSYRQSLLLVSQAMIGAAKMLQYPDSSIDQLIDDVVSPGGTTAAGLKVFDNLNIDERLQTVILDTIVRSNELREE